jgi:CubicO group peptidase (beta-lactamase class C family)
VLGPKAVASTIAEHWSGYDRFAEAPARYAAGFQMSDATYPFSGSPDCIGFHGIGGSIGFADPSRRMSFAYCGNRLISGSAGANPKSRRLIAGCFGT